MKIKYIVPSYKRAKTICTLDYLSKAVAVVSEDEIEEYRKCHPQYDESRFIECPREFQGKGKPKVLNWILDNLFSDCDCLIELDDDIHAYMVHMKNEKDRILDEEEVYEIFENNCRIAKEWGCGMYAFGKGGSDRLMHNPSSPFRLHSVGSGQLLAFVKNDGIRFDEELFTSEDIDIQLQSIQRYHKLLTVDRYYLDVKQWDNKGGYQELRDGKNTDRHYRDVLQRKWGNKIVNVNKKQRGGVSYSINVPLKGV